MESGNHFVDSLAPGDLALLQPHLKAVALKRDESLAEIGRPVRAAFLPIDSIISVITAMRDGRLVESRTIGREGGFGLLHALGSDVSFESVITQVPGRCFVIPAAALASAASHSPTLVRQIVQHAQATIVQAAQWTGCNALHETRERLCRWLLLTQDRLGKDLLPLTQEHLSIMLGVQRTTVTLVASQLQREHLISYSRGRVEILDRSGLKAMACECYAAVEEAVQQVLEPGC